MKRLTLCVGAVVALIGTPALAADLAAKAPPPTVVAPVPSWTGFYVGGNVGGAWSKDNATLSFPDALSFIDPLTVNTGRIGPSQTRAGASHSH
jgi:outer membrane immunogenic protein